MFCTSIRRRPSFAAVLPNLQAQDGLRLRGLANFYYILVTILTDPDPENRLIAHDLAIPLDGKDAATSVPDATSRRLRVLLLSPSCMASLDSTTQRIEHFALLTGHQDLAVIFLLNPPHDDTTFTSAKQLLASASPESATIIGEAGLNAYTTLRAHLMNTCPTVLSIPMLPLTTLDGLPNLLRKHIGYLTRPAKIQPIKPVPPLELLALCTAAGTPLSSDTTNILSDVFPDFRSLALACTEPETDTGSSSQPIDVDGQETEGRRRLRMLRELVGEREFRDIVDFWRDEYIVH